jgi:hypothetical protein
MGMSGSQSRWWGAIERGGNRGIMGSLAKKRRKSVSSVGKYGRTHRKKARKDLLPFNRQGKQGSGKLGLPPSQCVGEVKLEPMSVQGNTKKISVQKLLVAQGCMQPAPDSGIRGVTDPACPPHILSQLGHPGHTTAL